MLEGCTGQKVAAKRPALFVIPSLINGCHHRTGTGKFLISTSLTVKKKVIPFPCSPLYSLKSSGIHREGKLVEVSHAFSYYLSVICWLVSSDAFDISLELMGNCSPNFTLVCRHSSVDFDPFWKVNDPLRVLRICIPSRRVCILWQT